MATFALRYASLESFIKSAFSFAFLEDELSQSPSFLSPSISKLTAPMIRPMPIVFKATENAVAATVAALDVVAITIFAALCASRDVAVAFDVPPSVVLATACASVAVVVAFVEVPSVVFAVACVFEAVLAAFDEVAVFAFAVARVVSPSAASFALSAMPSAISFIASPAFEVFSIVFCKPNNLFTKLSIASLPFANQPPNPSPLSICWFNDSRP